MREKRGEGVDLEHILLWSLFIGGGNHFEKFYCMMCKYKREAKTRLNVNLFMFDDKIFCLNEVLKYLLWTVMEENKLRMISIRSCGDEVAEFCLNKDKLFWNNPHCQLLNFQEIKNSFVDIFMFR